MAKPAVPTALSWHVKDWPKADQHLWAANIVPADPFAEDSEAGANYGATLRPQSLKKVRKGYGSWLSFLDTRGWLDPGQAPLERVTVPRLWAYLRAMRRLGNQPSTIIGRFCDLTMAMRVMEPGKDVSWICKPNGVTIYSLLPKTQKVVQVPPSEILFAWGIGMMDSAGALADPLEGLLAYRDGLLIALLAARARRRGSMALLTVSREFFKVGDHYRVELEAHQTKNKKPDRFDLPVKLTPYIDRYLEHVRPALLGVNVHTALWVGKSGQQLTVKGLGDRLPVLSRKRFGYAFGPHAFRHALSTMLAEDDPQNTGLAPSALSITPQVNSAHYNRAQQGQSFAKLASVLERRMATVVAGGRGRRCWTVDS